jgi:negative regulator of sigma E activity
LSSASSEVAAKWARLNASQAVIHGEGSELYKLSDGFAARVAEQIATLDQLSDDQPSYSEKPQQTRLGAVLAAPWTRGITKLAVAASVAVAFVVALQTSLPGNEAPALMVMESAESSSGDSREVMLAEASTPARTTEVDADAQQRLRDYIASMSFSSDEPVRIEHIQDSPLYRLVSETIESPPQR